MDRRSFLTRSIKLFFALVGVGSLTSVFFLYPPGTRNKEVQFFPVLDEEDLPKQGVKRVDFSYEKNNRTLNTRAFIVISGSRIRALSPVCTHLGCLVNWDHNSGEFLCPCHGGRYDRNGAVIAGPPPAPLSEMPLMLKDRKVFIGMKA